LLTQLSLSLILKEARQVFQVNVSVTLEVIKTVGSKTKFNLNYSNEIPILLCELVSAGSAN